MFLTRTIQEGYMVNKVQLAAEAGGIPVTWPESGAPEYVARLDFAMLRALGIAPSIREASERWRVSFGVARRLISEAEGIVVSLQTDEA